MMLKAAAAKIIHHQRLRMMYTIEEESHMLEALGSITGQADFVQRRKFSNVSDAVTRRISTTMGWRSPATDEVVPQAKYLCSQYIRSRLKRAGLLNKKLGLQRLRSVANMAGGWEVCEVFPRVSCLGQEMERSHPKLYGSVVRQLSVSIKSDKVVRHLVLAISSHLLRTDVTWARLISLYAVAAALAADCVRQGHPEFVSSVIEGVGMAIEQHSCQWIVAQGGWSGVLVWSQPPAFEPTPLEMVGLVGGAGVLLAAIIGGALSLLGHLIS
uniref:Bcl-2-related ovarian killer protein homolog A n=1 Tax=Hirondellea gigas TaxID=1518452 RepID=A0A6A7FTK9_9CRUS